MTVSFYVSRLDIKKALANFFSAYYIKQVTEIRERSSVGQSACLSRKRSRVRASSFPPLKDTFGCLFCYNDQALTSSRYRIIASHYAVVHIILLSQNFHSLCSVLLRSFVRFAHFSLRKIRSSFPPLKRVRYELFFYLVQIIAPYELK